MKKILMAIAVALVFAACSGKGDANEENFRVAIEEYLKKEGDLCLRSIKWPVDFDAMDLRIGKGLPGSSVGQMAAFEAVGLARSSEVEVPAVGFLDGKPTGAKVKIKRYVLTDAAKPFLQTKDKKEVQTDMCWGKKALDKVVKWQGPMKLGDYQAATVIYHYRIEGLADWAQKPEILAVFPHIGRIIEAAGKTEERASVELTSLGWEVK